MTMARPAPKNANRPSMSQVFRVSLVAGLFLSLIGVPSTSSATAEDPVLAAADHPLVLAVGNGGSSGEVVASGDGPLMLSSVSGGSPTSVRSITGSAPPGEESVQPLTTETAATMNGALTWEQGVRRRKDSTSGTVDGGDTVVRTLTPTAPGELSFSLEWDPTYLYGQVTRTASGGVAGTSSSQSMSVQDAPDLFTVNAPGQVHGVLSWEESTLPPRNLDLYLEELGVGQVAASDDVLDNPERIDYALPSSVDHDSPRVYSFSVRNRGTESHDYTLGWGYPVTAEVGIELIDPDGTAVDVATGTSMSGVVSTTVAAADVDRQYQVRITSSDHEADFAGSWTSFEPAHADVTLTLQHAETGDIVEQASDDDGSVEFTTRLEDAAPLEWTVRNTTAGFEATSMPSYELVETVTAQEMYVESGQLAPSGSGGDVVAADGPGPMHVDVEWEQSSILATLERTAALNRFSTNEAQFKVTGNGAIDASLAWTEPDAHLSQTESVQRGLSPSVAIPIPIERTGTIDLTVSPALPGAGLKVELINQNGAVVVSRTQGTGEADIPIYYDVSSYNPGQADYTLRVGITETGVGGSFTAAGTYPVTADLDLQLSRDGTVVASATPGNPTTISFDHTGDPANYSLRVKSQNRGVPQFTLTGTHPAHAAVTATVVGPDGPVGTVTDDDGFMSLDTTVAEAGGYAVDIVNGDGMLDVPSYNVATFSPSGPPIDAEVTVSDSTGATLATVDADATVSLDVGAGTYTATATSDHTGTVSIYTLQTVEPVSPVHGGHVASSSVPVHFDLVGTSPDEQMSVKISDADSGALIDEVPAVSVEGADGYSSSIPIPVVPGQSYELSVMVDGREVPLESGQPWTFHGIAVDVDDVTVDAQTDGSVVAEDTDEYRLAFSPLDIRVPMHSATVVGAAHPGSGFLAHDLDLRDVEIRLHWQESATGAESDDLVGPPQEWTRRLLLSELSVISTTAATQELTVQPSDMQLGGLEMTVPRRAGYELAGATLAVSQTMSGGAFTCSNFTDVCASVDVPFASDPFFVHMTPQRAEDVIQNEVDALSAKLDIEGVPPHEVYDHVYGGVDSVALSESRSSGAAKSFYVSKVPRDPGNLDAGFVWDALYYHDCANTSACDGGPLEGVTYEAGRHFPFAPAVAEQVCSSLLPCNPRTAAEQAEEKVFCVDQETELTSKRAEDCVQHVFQSVSAVGGTGFGCPYDEPDPCIQKGYVQIGGTLEADLGWDDEDYDDFGIGVSAKQSPYRAFAWDTYYHYKASVNNVHLEPESGCAIESWYAGPHSNPYTDRHHWNENDPYNYATSRPRYGGWGFEGDINQRDGENYYDTSRTERSDWGGRVSTGKPQGWRDVSETHSQCGYTDNGFGDSLIDVQGAGVSYNQTVYFSENEGNRETAMAVFGYGHDKRRWDHVLDCGASFGTGGFPVGCKYSPEPEPYQAWYQELFVDFTYGW